MKRWARVFLLGCSLLLPSFVLADDACPQGPDIPTRLLVGRWQVELHSGSASLWTLTLQPHPEHIGSLRGTLSQGTQQAMVVADWDDGEFTMEESHDGQRIAATWLATASPGQCGRQLEGSRHTGDGANARSVRFTMRSIGLR